MMTRRGKSLNAQVSRHPRSPLIDLLTPRELNGPSCHYVLSRIHNRHPCVSVSLLRSRFCTTPTYPANVIKISRFYFYFSPALDVNKA